jgi:hypothetical protein
MAPLTSTPTVRYDIDAETVADALIQRLLAGRAFGPVAELAHA